MKNDALKHIIDYLFLALILAAGLIAILLFKQNLNLQIVSAIIMGVAYILWGVVHHYFEKTLNLVTLLEYVAISTLVTIIMIVFLLQKI